MPTHLQLGASVWRVPDIRGTEGGIGLYLLSKTINNDDNRLPSAFEFGSHVGAGLRLGESGSIGIALQHLSNAGIKQPNGGIDLVLVQYTFTH